MNRVEKILLEKSAVPGTLFVFPTTVSSAHWAERLLTLRGGGAAAMEQFIAWDTFKQESIRAQKQRKNSVNAPLRKIFAACLVRENAEQVRAGKPPVFTSLIPPRYAESAAAFASWFSTLLPQLGAWHGRAVGRPVSAVPDGGGAADLSADEQDLLVLAERYRTFLDAHDLFEPAWEKPPFEDMGRDCYIFFPGCLSDFNEYRELLEQSKRVTLVELDDRDTVEKPFRAFFFANSRSEITAAALHIRALVEKEHAAWNSIAVSIPEDAGYEAAVLREFANRNIPLVRRTGKPLASYPAGKLFSALAVCCREGFSFDSLAALLLNTHLPWRDSAAIHQLADFGIRNNCIASWESGGKEIDVWLDAFSSPAGTREKRAEDFYRLLKRDITAINRAPSFAALLEAYFIFRGHFLDMDACRAESDLVLSRCIAELHSLADIEKICPDIKIPAPCSLFTEHLAETLYLPREESAGVSLLPYRTAAPVPFSCHIILGATQENCSAVFSRLHFLPRARRESLGIGDEDASEIFIRLHRHNSELPAAFFCAEETFSGYAIPHPLLGIGGGPENTAETGELFAEDLFRSERRHLEEAGRSAPENSPDAGGKNNAARRHLHRVQAAGFDAWRARRGAAENSAPFTAGPALRSLIAHRHETETGKARISATALKSWHFCGLFWLFERILRLENVRMETSLMAENTAGIMYHAILEGFFRSVKRIDGGVLAGQAAGGLVPAYRTLLAEEAAAVFSALPFLSGGSVSALTARLLRAEQKTITEAVQILLEKFIACFGGFRVLGSEIELSAEEAEYCLLGKIDCLLEDCRDDAPLSGARAIVDFKLKRLPRLDGAQGRGENGLEDFQLPVYITLAEKDGGGKVDTAVFFSILDAKPEAVFGTVTDARTGKQYPYRLGDRFIPAAEPERYAAVMAEFREKAARFASGIKNGVFNTTGVRERSCHSCAFRLICRTVYAVGGDHFLGGGGKK
ncbi:MAG: PD-(D/E)XK nuclease family protein [Spirochaetaceae bacterium]|jgi:hypothetical protein|nr:PD-(D/E)XK nuclease family protein [Spirochaetaceae bacterium]